MRAAARSRSSSSRTVVSTTPGGLPRASASRSDVRRTTTSSFWTPADGCGASLTTDVLGVERRAVQAPAEWIHIAETRRARAAAPGRKARELLSVARVDARRESDVPPGGSHRPRAGSAWIRRAPQRGCSPRIQQICASTAASICAGQVFGRRRRCRSRPSRRPTPGVEQSGVRLVARATTGHPRSTTADASTGRTDETSTMSTEPRTGTIGMAPDGPLAGVDLVRLP